MPLSTPAERIRAFREGAGLSRAKLAVRTGVSLRTLARVELDGDLPKVGALQAIARELGVTIDEILHGRDTAA
jgi:transcriptional regulator with XRE-family HTH domain